MVGDQNKLLATKDRRIDLAAIRSISAFPAKVRIVVDQMNFCRQGFAKGQGPRAKDRIVGDQNEFLTP